MKNRLAAFFMQKGGVVYGGIAELEKLVQTGRKKFVKYCKNRQTVVRS